MLIRPRQLFSTKLAPLHTANLLCPIWVSLPITCLSADFWPYWQPLKVARNIHWPSLLWDLSNLLCALMKLLPMYRISGQFQVRNYLTFDLFSCINVLIGYHYQSHVFLLGFGCLWKWLWTSIGQSNCGIGQICSVPW